MLPNEDNVVDARVEFITFPFPQGLRFFQDRKTCRKQGVKQGQQKRRTAGCSNRRKVGL